jgi:hypothetical protein
MEIAEYLRVIRKRAWIVLLIPALAAALMTAIILSRPTEYSSTATVAAPWLISNAPGDSYAMANGPSQFVADFTAAISIPPVVDAVAQATGASPDSIRENVTAAPIDESTLIQVRFIGADQRQAEPVARAIALETLRFLFRPSGVAGASEPDEGSPGQSLPPDERFELLLAQPETVSVSPTRIEPTGPDLIRGLQVAVGGGLLLGLLVVIALEMLPFDRLRAPAAQSVGDRAESDQPKSANVGDESILQMTTRNVGGRAGSDKGKRPTASDEDNKPTSPNAVAEGNKRKRPNAADEGNKPTSPSAAEGNKRKRPNAADEGNKPTSPSADEGNKRKRPNAADEGNKPTSPSAATGDEAAEGKKRKSPNVGNGNEGDKPTSANAGDGGEGTKQLSPNAGDHADGNKQRNWTRKGNRRMSWTR